jgi:hypothetical protein
MLEREGRKSRILAAVLALAVPAFAITACNDDPLFDLPPDPPTNVTAAVQGNDVTIGWTPGINATSQEVRLTNIVPVPLSAGNALQAEDLVQVFNDNTTNTATFTDLEAGTWEATVTAINASSRAPSEGETFQIAGSSNTPTITSFTAVQGSPTTLRIEWTDVDGEENYRVTATPDDDSPEYIDIASANATFFEFSGAVVGATYTAQVCAIFAGDVEECSATATYTVAENQAPVVTIVLPVDATEYFDTEQIIVEGSATDDEDGAIPAENLEWSSDVDGVLGLGETFGFNAADATLGAHVITLTATDSEGAAGEASVNITIVEAGSDFSFATDVQPFFVDNGCTGCHVDGGVAGSIPLDSYDAIVTGTNTADPAVPLIVIGDASGGSLIPLLGTDHAGGPYDAFATDTLSVWVDGGAPNN